LEEPEPAVEMRADVLLGGGVEVIPEAVEVVAGVEIVDPVELRFLAIPPRAVRPLSRAAVLDGRAGHPGALGPAGVSGHAGEQARPQKVRVVDRELPVGEIAQAVPLGRPFTRYVEDPPAGAVGDVEPRALSGDLEGLHECVADESRPYDDRVVLRVRAAP